MLGGVTRHMLPHLPTLGPPSPCKQALREHNDQALGYVVYSSAVTLHAGAKTCAHVQMQK